MLRIGVSTAALTLFVYLVTPLAGAGGGAQAQARSPVGDIVTSVLADFAKRMEAGPPMAPGFVPPADPASPQPVSTPAEISPGPVAPKAPAGAPAAAPVSSNPYAQFDAPAGPAAAQVQAGIANDCWIAGPMQCTTGFSSKNYALERHTEHAIWQICLTKDGGSVSADDLTFTRWGQSTLIGVGGDRGMETVSTYQVDRQRRRLLYTGTRIGTANVIPILPDKVTACVGNAVPAPDSTPRSSNLRVR